MGTELLNKTEITRLAKCEATIEAGLSSFIDVGNALAEVRDEKLHRATHTNFKDYVRERWNIEGSYAFRLIKAAETVAESPVGHSIPNERIARELADVPPKAHRKVMAEASKDGAPTAATVREAAASLLPPVLRDRLSGDDEKDEEKEPAQPWDDFNASINDVQSLLRSACGKLRDAIGYDAETKRAKNKWARNFTGAVGELNQIIRRIGDALPAGLDAKRPGGYVTAAELDAKKSIARK